MTQPSLRPEVVRRSFNGLPYTVVRTDPTHTHPKAASDRNAAVSFMERFSAVLGLTHYSVQKSREDERRGRDGSRAFYWAKDLPIAPTMMVVPTNPLIAFVDTDQYINMPSFLCDNPHPTLIHTFQPDQVAKVTDTYAYTFLENDKVEYCVTGGSSYLHNVWNYSTDHLLVHKSILGIRYKTSAFLVDRRATSPDHELILLSPVGSWSLLGSLAVWACISGRDLSRLKVFSDGYLRLRTSSSAGMMSSTGKPGSYSSSTVPIQVDDTIAAVARSGSYPLSMPVVLSFVEGDRVAAAPLLEYHRDAKISGIKPDIVCPVSEGTRVYQYNPMNYYPNAKLPMKPFMTPLVHGGFIPAMCVNNEEECISARVERPRPKNLPLSSFLARCMQEFAELLIPNEIKHSMDPVDYEEVMNRQSRPAQRRTLQAAESSLPKRLVNMFMKKEPYANVKAPRPVSVMNPVDKREYCRYIYALEAILKVQPWYAFGRKPCEIAIRVAEVLSGAAFATNTDFAKFDGHGSNVMRELEKIVLMRAFRQEHHPNLLDLHSAQFRLKAYGFFDSRYELEFARASGSPETSLFNSLVNAFTAYLALRLTKVDDIHFQPADAYKMLGIYGGDDGLTANVEEDIYKQAASTIGQEVTCEVITRGSFGIKFLARQYSANVWYGDTNTCCDILRQMSKLHLTVNTGVNVTPQLKLLEKVRSFILTDQSTPIIGDFCSRVHSVYGQEIVANDLTKPIRTWLSKFDKEVQYPNIAAQWMMDYVESAMPDFNYKKFTAWLLTADTLEKLMNAPIFMEPVAAKSDIPVVVDGNVLPLGVTLKPAMQRKIHKPSSLKVYVPVKLGEVASPPTDFDSKYPVPARSNNSNPAKTGYNIVRGLDITKSRIPILKTTSKVSFSTPVSQAFLPVPLSPVLSQDPKSFAAVPDTNGGSRTEGIWRPRAR